jgi:hypothetical protein
MRFALARALANRYAFDQHPQHGANVSPMPTELVYVPLDDPRLTALAQASEAMGLTVEEIVQQSAAEFLSKRRGTTL